MNSLTRDLQLSNASNIRDSRKQNVKSARFCTSILLILNGKWQEFRQRLYYRTAHERFSELQERFALSKSARIAVTRRLASSNCVDHNGEDASTLRSSPLSGDGGSRNSGASISFKVKHLPDNPEFCQLSVCCMKL